jgi:hypothetical protein
MIDLKFDEEKHEYALDGLIVPSVTQILKAEGYHNPFIEDDYAAQWGTMAHKIVELYLTGRLISYDPVFERWMEGIRQFRTKHLPKGDYERRVYWSFGPMQYAGTADFIGMIGSREYVLDWKFWSQKTDELVSVCGLQTAAYEQATRNGRERRRGVVWFKEGGFELIPLTDPTDLPMWRSILNGFYWKNTHLNRRAA